MFLICSELESHGNTSDIHRYKPWVASIAESSLAPRHMEFLRERPCCPDTYKDEKCPDLPGCRESHLEHPRTLRRRLVPRDAWKRRQDLPSSCERYPAS